MTEDAPDPRQIARSFHAMSLGQLLEAWDEPMAEEERALLLAELEARGYRTNALEAPPERAPASTMRPTQRLELLRERRVRNGSLVVLLIAAFTLVGAVIATFDGGDEYSARKEVLAGYADEDLLTVEGEEKTAAELRSALEVGHAVELYFPYALAGAFLVLYFWSRAAPKFALALALLIYAGLQGVHFATQPFLSPIQLVVPLLFTLGIGSGWLAALSASKPAGIEQDEFWGGV